MPAALHTRRVLATVLLAVGAALGVVGFALLSLPHPGAAEHRARPCSASVGGIRLTTGRSGWIAGDGALSVPLGPHRSLWLFGDSIVLDDRGWHPVRNAMVLDQAGLPRTLGAHGRSHFRVPGAASERAAWFWPAHGVAAGASVWVVLSEMASIGGDVPEAWDFRFAGSWLARLDAASLRLRSLRRAQAPAGVLWGASVLRAGAMTYVFGVVPGAEHYEAVVARTPGPGLQGPWTPWTARGWRAGGQPVPIATHVGTQLSVVPVAGGYAMLTQAGYEPAARIVALRARRPEGPWGARTTAYAGPVLDGATSYGAAAHPEYGPEGSLLVSYSTAAADPLQLFVAPELTRPRFAALRLACLAVPRGALRAPAAP